MRDLSRLLTTRGQAVVAAGIVLVLAGILLGVRDLTRVGVLATAIPLLASFVSGRHDLGFTIEREARPARLRPDEPCEVRLRVTNSGRRSSPVLMAEEAVDYTLGDRPRFVVPSLSPGESRTIRYVVRSHERGRHRIGPLGIRIRDPFGLSARTAAHRSSASVLVLPRTYALTQARPKGTELGSDGSIPHRISLHGEDDASIRAYREGDDLRRIHWPATARTGEIMVRQEDRPARRRAVVLLDTRASAHGDTGANSSLEWAVSMAASVSVHLLELGYAVHLVTADSSASTGVREAGDVDHLLDDLAEVGPSSDADHLAAERHAAALSAAGGLVVTIIAPLEDAQARGLASLRRSGSNGIAVVIAPGRDGRGRAGAERTAAVLRLGGWSALPTTTSMAVPDAWAAVVGTERSVVPR